ncbi:MarR family winged helix-turn-helix transcriptional regulator [Nakamurella multipartita]|uniref:Transcriptional regulator, MarR family n=1 Tax=Nakamurella multipartita (strain ATCC 700099 / DSM 44233 / CIP 104796 / JCM 9543 / NBRC 105858 / Y-104) TaxID=479431 RepID=C8X9A8_NAKMY|nr:MarR family transcriptional regulator [Nakamurella multipartita]ACV77176.1 transcriptional regulator, MarR family [Nakamurella multipartita DSM 44233]
MTDTLVAAPATDPTPTGPDALLAESADIAGAVVDLMRQLHGIKARLAVGPEADHSPLLLLAKLVHAGPQRASALADLVGADPSTVSRQVAALVKAGLVVREADPDDGRACLLVPTALGRERVQEYRQRRAAAMAPLIQDWTAHERADFLRLLRKYVTSIDAHRDDVIATLTAHPQKGQ